MLLNKHASLEPIEEKKIIETELTVSTTSDLIARIDTLEAKLDNIIANLGLNKEVLEKESRILDKIGELLGVQ